MDLPKPELVELVCDLIQQYQGEEEFDGNAVARFRYHLQILYTQYHRGSAVDREFFYNQLDRTCGDPLFCSFVYDFMRAVGNVILVNFPSTDENDLKRAVEEVRKALSIVTGRDEKLTFLVYPTKDVVVKGDNDAA